MDTGTLLYHGTRVTNLSGISQSGLQASATGRLGQGVYFTTKDYAHAISRNRGKGTGVVVLECKVDLQNCFSIGYSGHGASYDQYNSYNGHTDASWQNSYNSCNGTHPAWGGISQFPEWCLKDPKRCKIVGVYLVDGVIEGPINFPGATIHTSGTCTVKGQINVGTINISGTLIIG